MSYESRTQEHARHVRDHSKLSAKNFGSTAPTPELVVMFFPFLPGEAFFSAAAQQEKSVSN